MSISLNKKTGINLTKGSGISLEKDGNVLKDVCIGINWGMIKKKSFFGLLSEESAVDLDGSVVLYDENKNQIDLIYFKNLLSKDEAVKHSGDDTKGDSKADEFDNEVIEINLTKLSKKVSQMVFFINSYLGQDFATIPYSKIRIFEGNKKEVKNVLATFNLSSESNFSGHTAMIMGKMMLLPSGKWEFKAIGQAVKTKNISETISEIQKNFL
jgi:tellurium resistance protein TerZ